MKERIDDYLRKFDEYKGKNTGSYFIFVLFRQVAKIITSDCKPTFATFDVLKRLFDLRDITVECYELYYDEHTKKVTKLQGFMKRKYGG